MHGKLISSALLGISALGLAAPLASFAPTGTYTTASAEVTGKIIEKNGEEVFEYPLSNGFPTIANPSSELTDIELEAHGTLPNGPPPPTPQSDSLTSLGFIAFNELFEVAFFTELIQNITENKPGYDSIPNRDEVLSILEVVQAQEELHELNANGAFNKFTGNTILPCEYVFPVDNFNDAIALASKFTDVVLGTLPDIQTIFANDGDNGLIRGVGSVIGQEGEQNGFYRLLQGLNPSALPFLTASSRDFAFSAINQNFVVPGSCPSIGLLDPPLKIFGTLSVLTSAADITSATDSLVEYSIDLSTLQSNSSGSAPPSAPPSSPSPHHGGPPPHHGGPLPHHSGHGPFPHHPRSESWSSISSNVFITYINQQNVPFSEKLQDVKVEGEIVTFKALFPGKTNEMNGLTIAALTLGEGPFADVDAVEDATLFGPGLIEVN